MTSDDPRSIDFDYKKYSLSHVDEWVHDALNCENTSPQEIYDAIVKCVDDSLEYHKSHLTKSIELLSLLKGQHSFVDDNTGASDWADFWHEYPSDSQYTLEEVDAMCDAAEEKEKCREYNRREAEYYDKRAQLDAQYADPYAKLIKEAGGYEWTP